ncbi:hypothetical protein [Ahrensia sp. R2A130]|uniref:hypothetical protein n=1 Tax=Ahrensia sp. R2A130 TaxID=744979 RepID=UPI0001E0BCBA|nr:hypothetical protein [Ahrensia sp. R2A130]EFL88322.1 putative glutathione S-transferase domain-containing protein [Ahrensia sp. R2A130]
MKRFRSVKDAMKLAQTEGQKRKLRREAEFGHLAKASPVQAADGSWSVGDRHGLTNSQAWSEAERMNRKAMADPLNGGLS